MPSAPGRVCLAIALCAIPVLVQLVLVYRLGVNMPTVDELYYVDFVRAIREGGDWWPWIWLQHNEHRMVATKLVMIPNALWQWNRVVEMYVSVGLAGLIVVGYWRLARQSGEQDPLAIVPLAWLTCSLAQYENMLYGLLTQYYFCVLGLVWSLVYVDRVGWRSLAAAIVTATLASTSVLNGMLVWPAGIFVLLARRRSAGVVASWCIAGAVVAWLYFRSFADPPKGVTPSLNIGSIDRIVSYGLTALGAPLGAGSEPWARIVGLLILVCVISAPALHRLGVRTRAAQSALPLALAGIGIVTCAMLAVARTGTIVIPPLESRYIAFSSIAVAGAYLLARARVSEIPAPQTRRFASAALWTVVIVGLFAANLHGWQGAQAWRTLMLQWRYMLQTFETQPAGTLEALLPLTEARRMVTYLQRERLGPFGEPLDMLFAHRPNDGVPLSEVLPASPVELIMTCPVRTLYDVSVAFATYQRANTSTVDLSIVVDGRLAGSRSLSAADIIDNGSVVIRLDPPVSACANRTLAVWITSPDGVNGNAVTAWTFPPYYAGELRQRGELVPGRSLGVTLNGVWAGSVK